MAAALALLSSLLWGTSDYLGGTVTRRLPATTVIVVSQAVAFVLLIPLALVVGVDLERRTVLAGVLAGVVGPAALAAFYRALATGTMGVVAPIAALGVAVPVVAGLAGGEEPGSLQLAGIAVAVVGVVLACGPELGGEGRGGAAPLLLALLSALGFGVVFVLLAEGSEGAGAGVAEVVLVLLVMRATSVLLLGTALAAGRALSGGGEARPRAGARDLPVLGVIGVFDVGANGAFAVASQSDLVSVTAVLASLYPVVTAVLAWRLQGERLRPLQVAGVAAALVGVLLLAAG
jgi:drug/metabolite transporter (DMT)-like permease